MPQILPSFQGRLTTPLAISVAAVTFGSSFQFGYHTGYVTSQSSNRLQYAFKRALFGIEIELKI